MSYVKIWIHIVWAVKERKKLLVKSLRPELIRHIKENAITKNIFIDEINCTSDHIHILISLGAKQTVSDVVRLLKGESSHWLNSKKKIKFSWQEDYYAASVCESIVDKVREYIKNQEEHHRKKSFSEEAEEFLQKYGFGKVE